MKRLFKCGIIVVLCMVMVSANGMITNAQMKVKSLEVSAVTQSKNSIKLKWKKSSVAQFRIYRAPVKKDGSTGKFKKITVISGKKTSFTDKVSYKKHFEYRVTGYKKKGKKLVKACSGGQYAYSGVGEAQWEEYFHSDAAVTPKAIPLKVQLAAGFCPTAYEIYRSTNGKQYKKLAVVKKKSYSLSYKDKKVKSLQTYYYKVRAYREINGKKYYGEFTKPLKLSAVHAIGKYKVKLLTPESDSVSVLTVCVTSDKNNADLIFTQNSGNDMYLYSEKQGKSSYVNVRLSKYSYDNKTWNTVGKKKKTTVKPGQSIYLQFVPEDGKPFSLWISDMENVTLESVDVEYNKLSALLSMELKNMTGESRVNGEMYH